jgi:hypothetical protein
MPRPRLKFGSFDFEQQQDPSPMVAFCFFLLFYVQGGGERDVFSLLLFFFCFLHRGRWEGRVFDAREGGKNWVLLNKKFSRQKVIEKKKEKKRKNLPP